METADPAGRDFGSVSVILQALRAAQRILVTSHANADGDAVGSALGLARGLSALGKESSVWLGDLPRKYSFLVRDGEVRVFDQPPDVALFSGFDLAVILDANELSRVGPLESGLAGTECPKICVDHHLTEGDLPFDSVYIRPDVAATSSLVLELLDGLGVELEGTRATPLFVGLATDTGWFRHENVSPDVFRDAKRLIESGADAAALYTAVYENVTRERLALQGRVLSGMRLAFDDTLVWSALDAETIAASGVPRSDFEGLIDPLRTIDGVAIAAFLCESVPGRWKLSLRSCDPWDVQRIARRLGGGGHKRAAGCTVEGDQGQVEAILQREAGKELAGRGSGADGV